jgi:glycine/serine hydroxymethyltransferase
MNLFFPERVFFEPSSLKYPLGQELLKYFELKDIEIIKEPIQKVLQCIPGDTENNTVTSGIRLGTSAVTSRGFKEQDMKIVADLICLAATDYENSADKIRAQVNELCDKHQIYE